LRRLQVHIKVFDTTSDEERDIVRGPFVRPWFVSHGVNYARAPPQKLTDGDLKMAFGEETAVWAEGET
jgi:hypothetical protein